MATVDSNFILERRHPEYRERVADSGAVDIHVLMEDLNAGRQRVGRGAGGARRRARRLTRETGHLNGPV